MGTDGSDVEHFYRGAGLAHNKTGLGASEIDGEPLENLATGFGVVVATKAACEVSKLAAEDTSVAVEGFGKAGSSTVRYLAAEGFRVCAVSTVAGTLFDARGLDVTALLDLREKFGDALVTHYPGGQQLEKEALHTLPVDILVPGARPHVIDERNPGQVQAKIVCSIANIPLTDRAEEILRQRGVCVVPDFIANAGGVVVVLTDWLGGSAADVFATLTNILHPLTERVLRQAQDHGMSPRAVAVAEAKRKVLAARESGTTLSFEDLKATIRTRFAQAR